jgi:hypothetical protein
VRHVGEQPLLTENERLDPRSHVVERRGKLPYLVLPWQRRARTELTGAEAPHGARERFDGPYDGP